LHSSNKPIDYDDAKLDSGLQEIPLAMLAMLNPTINIDEVHFQAHTLHKADALMIESKIK
jgi:hypothetical protein